MHLPKIEEIGSTYAGGDDRFVVSLVVGYGAPADQDHVFTPQQAAYLALGLTQDYDCGDTNWYVYDRQTKHMHLLEQREFDPQCGAPDPFDDGEDDGDI